MKLPIDSETRDELIPTKWKHGGSLESELSRSMRPTVCRQGRTASFQNLKRNGAYLKQTFFKEHAQVLMATSHLAVKERTEKDRSKYSNISPISQYKKG
jgi:hypothetical protein